MAKKFRPKKEKLAKSKSKRAFYFALTFIFVLVVGITTLSVCWVYYKWQWATIAYWLNPFSEGNCYTWIVYSLIVIAMLAFVWLFHKDRQGKSGV